METFFDRLIFLIEKEEGGKHTVFARKADIKAGTFQNYINGRKPNFDALLNICKAYKVNLNWLVAGTGVPYIEGKKNLEKKEARVPTREILLQIDQWLTELTETDPGRDDWFKYNFIDAFPKFAAWLSERESEGDKGELFCRKVCERVD